MSLASLNARWQELKRPHAVTDDEGYHWVCPRCEGRGHGNLPLGAAMSAALAHAAMCRQT